MHNENSVQTKTSIWSEDDNEISVQRKASIWSADGRMGRKNFALTYLVYFSLLIVFLFLVPAFFVFLCDIFHSTALLVSLSAVEVIFLIGMFVFSIFVYIVAAIRRLHDLNMSGYYCLACGLISICTVGIGGVIVVILLCALPGTKGDNKYGKAVS